IAQAASGGAALQQQGTAVLRQGAAQLNSGLDALVAGSGSLKDGMSSLNGQLPALTDGVGRLQQGTKDLKDGTTQLVTGADTLTRNSPALNEGAAALTDGAGQIQSGAQQLADGSGELADGIDQLTDGANTLESSLADGADEIRSTNTGDAVVDMFAAPVVTEETQMTQVPNNGHAMAPYMMSVALWVGCIAFSLMYPLTEYAGKLKSGTAWWLSKASVLYPIAILQALVMVGALHAINGFDPGRMGQTLLVACVASVTFMSVMYFFTNLLGKVGSFLMLVFMVIQLAGSVGTYPLELSGSFVKYLHDWVPFTYTVTAFRRAICAGEDVTGCLAYLAVWLVVFTLLTILVFAVRAKRIKAEKPTLMVWLEEHHLA
ncbi:YhgE/Pip family protein, partial [Allofournierella massiliensis]